MIMKNLNNKIVIGTAQLDHNYGILKNRKKITRKKLVNIFDYLKEKNYLFIDTSSNYKNAENLLKNINLKKFKIISKIEILRNKKNIFEYLNKKVLKSIKKLNISSFEGYLLHDENDLFSSKSDEIFEALTLLKKRGHIKKIGISMYNFDKAIEVIKNYKIDIMQLPYNIFDRRLENSRLLKLASKKKIEIHVRSIFLQGLLLCDLKKIPNKLKKYKSYFKKIDSFCKKNDISKHELCLRFVMMNKSIKKIIIGIDDKKNILDVEKIKFKKLNFKFPKFFLKDKELIDPRKWS